VEKTPENELNVDQILNFFPSARFIHIIRDPRSNIASLKRLFKVRNWSWDTEAYAYSLRNSIELGFLNQERLGEEKYHILRYEDLVTTPAANIKNVARFLGIKMNKVLLSPSVNGLPAKSNTMFEDRQIQGRIFTTLTDKWKTELDPQEQKMIWAILHSIANRLGYKWDVGFAKRTYYLYYYKILFRNFLFRKLSRTKKN
ncbi:MAG: sulfotransferase, partial [Promethearchaeota archaeon]